MSEQKRNEDEDVSNPPEYGGATGSPDRVPEADRKMIFHVCQKLAVVLGLNAQEQAWLESLGATFPKANDRIHGREGSEAE
jgi:hypothetical protein